MHRLPKHRPHCNDCPGEDTSNTPKDNHLPERLAHTKKACRNSNSKQRSYKDWLSPIAIGSLFS